MSIHEREEEQRNATGYNEQQHSTRSAGYEGQYRNEANGEDHQDKASQQQKSPEEDADRQQVNERQTGREDEQGEKDEKDARIDELNEELNNTKEALMRKAAEYENLKRRVEKERAQIYEDARKEAVEAFLPVREDLVRSLEAAQQQQIDEKFLEGVQLVADKFNNVLDSYGVEPINDEMIPFDVNIHDAMMTQEAEDENVESNTVLKVVEPGYKINDRVIKHAKVIVSK